MVFLNTLTVWNMYRVKAKLTCLDGTSSWLLDEESRIIGRIGSTRLVEVELAGLPRLYWQYQERLVNEKGEMLVLWG